LGVKAAEQLISDEAKLENKGWPLEKEIKEQL
jgi:hypothetical protein